MEETKLQELGRRVNDIMVMTRYAPEQLANEINKFMNDINEVAMREAGCTSSDLADEAQEDSPRVRLFWVLQSQITGKAYAEAANQLSSYKGLDR